MQLDQVLGTLQTGTRKACRSCSQGYGEALNGKPQPGEDDDQVAEVKGKTGGQALNQTLKYSPEALRGAAVVNQALLGSDLHDLSKLVAGQQKVLHRARHARGVAQGPDHELQHDDGGAGRARATTCARRSHLLPGVLEAANPALDKLNAAFPATRAWALEMIPGVRETPATIQAGFPWIGQTTALLQPAELQGLVEELQPAIDDFARFTKSQEQLLPAIDLFNRCQLNVILPDRRKADQRRRVQHRAEELQGVLPDHGRARGRVAELRRQRLLHPLQARRRRLPGEDRAVGARTAPLFGCATSPPVGTRPARGGKPPYKPNAPCYNRRRRTWTPPRSEPAREARRSGSSCGCSWRSSACWSGRSALVGFILSKQRFYLPAWVPVLGTDFYEVKADLQTAQAVVPGQGQSVNVAGVKIGEVGDVRLENGTPS